MKVVRNATMFALWASAALLAGCDSYPDAGDVEAMLDKQKSAILKATGVKEGDPAYKMAVGMVPTVEINSVEDCEENQDAVLKCTVNQTTKMFGQEVTNEGPMFFKKNDEGDWVIPG